MNVADQFERLKGLLTRVSVMTQAHDVEGADLVKKDWSDIHTLMQRLETQMLDQQGNEPDIRHRLLVDDLKGVQDGLQDVIDDQPAADPSDTMALTFVAAAIQLLSHNHRNRILTTLQQCSNSGFNSLI